MVNVDSWWDSLTRGRSEAILELVINTVADDYESLEIILKSINEWYPSDPDPTEWKALTAIPVSRLEVVNALRELTREGYVQSYIYDGGSNQFRAVSFLEDNADDLWFYVTDKGLRAVKRLNDQTPETS